MSSERDVKHDVLILGSGLGGSMLAACLAAQGLSVQVLEGGEHPRFAIGEATTPDISFRLKLLSRRYGVPEIAALASFNRARDAIGPSVGVKRAFSFAYHRPGEPHRPEEVHQYPTFATPMGPDCHLFRQDSDAWMLNVALRYGADVEQRARVERVDLADDGVTAHTADGRAFTARFVVDAAGFGSPLSRQLGLLAAEPPFATDSRALFTHMLGVTPYDQLGEDVRRAGMRHPFSQGTLHHVFPGGWMWVIPFDNHVDAVNPLCSVGVMLDRAAFPDNDLPADQEFAALIARYPKIAAQLEGARAIRPWVKTRRAQQRVTQMVGDRWALLAHAGGFVDALYSSGLNLTTSNVDRLTHALVAACADDRFERARFEPIEAATFRGLAVYDRFVANSYRAFSDFDLWDAWYRVWVIALLIGTAVPGNLYMRSLEGDEDALADPGRAPLTGSLGSEVPEVKAWLEQAYATFATLDDGRPPAEVAAELRAQLKATPCSPDYWRWHDPAVRATPAFTAPSMLRLYLWFRMNAPSSLVASTFSWSAWTPMRYLLTEWWAQRKRGGGKARRFLRDAFASWNQDWR